MPRIEPASPAYAGDGTPMSLHYGDVYHSADSGPGQARHVFLGGNGLPVRWAGRASFTILETGFGIGVNFLATWDAWRRDAARPRRLHYVAIEKHPFLRDDLARMLAGYPEFVALARELVDRWPAPLPGTHRRVLEGGGISLTVVFDDVQSALKRLDARADAIYLDGFSPSRNPEMWSVPVLRALARRTQPGATCATWSTARAVRDGLADAGFAVELRPGFGHKREMLVGRHEPRGAAARQPPTVAREGERHAIVVGAGLAGTAAASSLASRGWRVTIVDAAPGPASGASSLHAGSFHPLVARDDSLLARLSRAAFLHTLDAWRELERRGHAIAWARCGVLQLARRHDGDDALRAAIDALGFPASFVEHVDAASGSARAGLRVDRPGAWFPEGGWARAPSIVRAQLDAAMAMRGSAFLGSRRVDALARTPDGWRVSDEAGATIAEASVVVLANAADIARLSPI
nr:tRNA (5-methylaminomethyl-2-thiouridine)(34)-methyltransferase MnmD [Burkholderiales bacterium]